MYTFCVCAGAAGFILYVFLSRHQLQEQVNTKFKKIKKL